MMDSTIQKSETSRNLPSTAAGFDLGLFIDTPPEKNICSSCELVMKDPCKLQCCNKYMCKECFENSNAQMKCPLCEEEDNDAVVIANKVKKAIMALKVKCCMKRCQWQGLLKDLDDHVHIMAPQLRHTNPSPVKPGLLVPPTPHEVIATIHDSNSIKLTWKIPENASHAVDEYIAFYCLLDDVANWIEYPKSIHTESIIFKNLKLGKTFFFKVQANYHGGEACSKSSKPIELPIMGNLDSHAYQLTSERNGTKRSSSTSSIPAGYVSDSEDRENYDQFANKVLQTSKNSITTLNSLPGCPEEPKIFDIQSDKILLKWKEPKSNSESVSQYTVSMQQQDNDPQYFETNSSDTRFEIDELMPATDYTFQIFAETVEGVRSAPSNIVRVHTKRLMPGPPGKPEAAKIHANMITLHWKKPKRYPGSVDSYKVSCYNAAIGRQKPEKFDEIEHIVENKCNIKNLSPKAKYVFSVQAISDERETEEIIYSEIIKTKGHQVSQPPNFFKIEKKQATSVQLKWGSPLNPAEKVISYLIEQRAFESSHWEEAAMVSASETSCEVYDLTQGSGYIFRIQAHTEFGASDWTESEKVFTTSLASGTPGKPRYKSISSNSIELQWNKPEKEDFVKVYEVVCYIFANKLEVKRKHSDRNFITFDELAPNSEYCFRVRAYCLNESYTGFSEYSKLITTKNLPMISGKPKGKDKTSFSVRLKWKLPAECDPDEISKYMILFAPAEAAMSLDSWKQLETTDNIPEFTVNSLHPDCGYVFKVRAKSKAICEYGPESQTSKVVQTDPISTSPPLPKVIGSNSITLMWNAPTALSSKHKLLYRIEYMSEYSYHASHQQWEMWPEKFQGTEGTIKRLKGGANYCFKVVLYTKGNEEERIVETEPSEWVKTKCPVPSPPGKPYAAEVTQSSVFLNWQKPLQNSEYVSYYNVYVMYKGKSALVLGNIPASDDTALIENLDSDTKYKFAVEAVNPDGKTAINTGDFVATERGLPSQPSRPYMLQVTDCTVKVAWEIPKHNSMIIARYIVSYKPQDAGTWKNKETKSNDTTMEVSKLKPSTKYLFQITPVTMDGEKGTNSEISEPVQTKSSLPSAPGKPKGKTSSANAITLKWDRPQQNFGTIAFYEIDYYESQQTPDKAQKKRTKGIEEEMKIDKLAPNKGYYFYVTAVTSSGARSPASLISDLITSDKSLAEKFLPSCDKISKEESTPEIYLLPKDRDDTVQKGDGLNKYDIKLADPTSVASGLRSKFPIGKLLGKKAIQHQHKVLMLLGATGSGKSTLVNGMINYIMRVQFGDHFRLKLIHESNTSQTQSVTSEVSAYTVQNGPGFQLSYTFTIVDTPGFGDTGGITEDKKITEKIKKFFNMKQGGIPHLDGIGFVCQSGGVRLTPTQRYIFDSIFAMFGNDVKNNVFVMCTFCDDDEPQVVQAIKEVSIPADKFYKFNNSALYSSSRGKMTESFWEIGVESFRGFFQDFENASPVSLTLTKEVLQHRETLETIVIGLQTQIQNGMDLINKLGKELKVLETNKDMIEQNKNFTYQVEEDKMVETPLDPNKYTTNCIKCNMTCHYPCVFPNSEQKVNCAAMSNNRGSDKASCGVCPGHCHWSSHRNASFRLVTERKVVIKEYSETLRKLEQAKSKKLSLESVIESIENEIDDKFQEVFDLVVEANKCMKKLDEIAFRPNHLNDAEYIQLLIDAQRQEKKPGYMERVEHYLKLQERAKILSQTGKIKDQALKGGKRWWHEQFMQSQ